MDVSSDPILSIGFQPKSLAFVGQNSTQDEFNNILTTVLL